MWLDGRGGGGPTPLAGEPLPPALERIEDVLDRYEQHTKFCPSCSRVRDRGCSLALGYLRLSCVAFS